MAVRTGSPAPVVPTVREDVLRTTEVNAALLELADLDSSIAAERLQSMEPQLRASVLRVMNPVTIDSILRHVPDDRSAAFLEGVPLNLREQWKVNSSFPAGSVGRLMDPPVGLLRENLTVAQSKEALRDIVKREFITYGYVVDESEKLCGVIVMRDLLFADDATLLSDIMLRNPFCLSPETDVMSAMKEIVLFHFPVYPVCNADGRIIGLVRGHRLFESQAFEITAQAGSMVGVAKEEHVSTPWPRSLKFRHPWLQLNLLTAFVAGAVVSVFQDTIDRMVVLAAFLPVLAGQSGNTGCQALAVTLRGMTLGNLQRVPVARLMGKEAFLGLINGALVGISAAVGMYLLASHQNNPDALVLSLIVLAAMTVSCTISGISGTVVPLALKRLGADPATASSIFLTTATDVASMGLLLGLATLILG